MSRTRLATALQTPPLTHDQQSSQAAGEHRHPRCRGKSHLPLPTPASRVGKNLEANSSPGFVHIPKGGSPRLPTPANSPSYLCPSRGLRMVRGCLFRLTSDTQNQRPGRFNLATLLFPSCCKVVAGHAPHSHPRPHPWAHPTPHTPHPALAPVAEPHPHPVLRSLGLLSQSDGQGWRLPPWAAFGKKPGLGRHQICLSSSLLLGG